MTKYEAIFRRKSVRKYTNEKVEEGILQEIQGFGRDAVGVRPDIRIKWKIYQSSDHKVGGQRRLSYECRVFDAAVSVASSYDRYRDLLSGRCQTQRGRGGRAGTDDDTGFWLSGRALRTQPVGF